VKEVPRCGDGVGDEGLDLALGNFLRLFARRALAAVVLKALQEFLGIGFGGVVVRDDPFAERPLTNRLDDVDDAWLTSQRPKADVVSAHFKGGGVCACGDLLPAGRGAPIRLRGALSGEPQRGEGEKGNAAGVFHKGSFPMNIKSILHLGTQPNADNYCMLQSTKSDAVHIVFWAWFKSGLQPGLTNVSRGRFSRDAGIECE
jgi:hypothetical protein